MIQFSLPFLQQALTQASPPRAIVRFWLGCSLFFGTLYGCLGLRLAFSSPFVVQDDARHHVFWMQRFIDPELLPNDLVADYFQSVAPAGYINLYKLAAFVGLDPLFFNKFVPLFLSILTALAAFYFCLSIIPVPAISFTGTLILLQNLWMDNNLVSGTPRAFIYVLLLGFLYALSRRSLWGCIALLILQGLFYPPTIFLCAGTVALEVVRFKAGKPHFSRQVKDYQFSLICLLAAAAVLLPFALATSPYEPLITLAEAKALPEFQELGRSQFFRDRTLDCWIGGRSGLLPGTILTPVTLAFAVFLPILQWRQLPLLRPMTPQQHILSHLTIVSLGMFAAAHLLLFKLYLPSRYTQHSLRIIFAFSAAIALFALLDLLLRWAAAGKSWVRQLPVWLACGVLGLATMGYPLFMDSFLDPIYVSSQWSELYTFLQEQPKDALVASLSRETDNISTFARRSVLFSQEQSVPYHRGYYNQIDRRIRDVVRAQYDLDLDTLKTVIREYDIDLWLLDRNSFDVDYLAKNNWLQQFQPETNRAIERLRTGEPPAIEKFSRPCQVFEDKRHIVLNAQCLLESSTE